MLQIQFFTRLPINLNTYCKNRVTQFFKQSQIYFFCLHSTIYVFTKIRFDFWSNLPAKWLANSSFCTAQYSRSETSKSHNINYAPSGFPRQMQLISHFETGVRRSAAVDESLGHNILRICNWFLKIKRVPISIAGHCHVGSQVEIFDCIYRRRCSFVVVVFRLC